MKHEIFELLAYYVELNSRSLIVMQNYNLLCIPQNFYAKTRHTIYFGIGLFKLPPLNTAGKGKGGLCKKAAQVFNFAFFDE